MTDDSPTSDPNVTGTLDTQLQQARIDLKRMTWLRDHAVNYARREEAAAATAAAVIAAKNASIERLHVRQRKLEEELDAANARATAQRPADPVVLLRGMATHRRGLAVAIAEGGPDDAEMVAQLRLQADTIDVAVAVLLGDTNPLYDWLPPYEWTPEMRAAIGLDRNDAAPAPVPGTEPGA